MEQYKAFDPSDLLEALKKLERNSIGAAAAAKEAEAAYYDNARERQAKVEARIDDLSERLEDCKSKIDALKKQKVEATATEDLAALTSIWESMKTLEAAKAQMQSDIETLRGAFITGGDEFYNFAVEENDHFLHAKETYRNAGRLLYELASVQMERYESIKRHFDDYGYPRGGGHGPDMKKLIAHHNADEMAKTKSMQEEEFAAQQAAETSRPTNAIKNTFYTAPRREDRRLVETRDGIDWYT